MKKRKINALLASVLAFSMAFSQPAAVFAEENTTVSDDEDNDITVTEDRTITEDEDAVQTPEDDVQTSEDEAAQIGSENVIDEENVQDSEVENGDKTEVENGEDFQVPQEDEETTPENGDDTQAPDEEYGSQTEDKELQSTQAPDADAVIIEAQKNGLSVEKQKKLNDLGFKTMKLDQNMISEKGELSQVVETMSSMKSDKDYIEGEVVYFADSEEEAKKIAECYGGTVSDYQYGIAIADIEQSVLDAVTVAADMSIQIPAVYPNIVYTILDDWDTSSVDMSEVTIENISEDNKTDLVNFGITDPSENQILAQSVNDPAYNKQWYHNNIHTLAAWGESDASKGAGVTVAVIDTGVDYTHPDLDDNIAGHISVFGGDGKDDNGHGTHCAGIIAAEANNNEGGFGIAPKAKILSVKVMDEDGLGNTAYTILGIEAAIENDVDVISLSLGSQYYDALSQKAVDKAAKKGIIVVAAAGNGYLYGDGYIYGSSQKTYPAAYNNAISVAATDDNNRLTYFSSYGDWIDIAAPGANIYSTVPTYKALVAYDDNDNIIYPTNYHALDGTSMACPIVAGTVALMLANNESLRNTNSSACLTRVKKELLASADADGAISYYYPGRSLYYNEADNNLYYPLLDVEQAVYAVDDTALTTPEITFSITPDSKNIIQAKADTELTLTIKTASEHDKIYYTINGKKPTASTGELYTEPVYLDGDYYYGKTKIQAIAVRGSKASKVISKTYTINYGIEDLYPVGTSEVTYVEADNIWEAAMNVAVGKSIQLSVDIYPYYAANTKLAWNCEDSAGLIKVNKSGKVTCNKNAEAGHTAVVTVASQDGSNKKCRFKITAVSAMVGSIELDATDLQMSYWANSEGVEFDETKTKYVDSYTLKVTSSGADNKQYLYKTSNKNVATVDEDGTIWAWSKGKAKITVTANDGSGKKAVCNVTVVTPVYNIKYLSSTGYRGGTTYSSKPVIPIATGCSISMKTWVNNSDYKYTGFTKKLTTPTNKTLEWKSSNESMLTVKNGKITCNKNATPGAIIDVTISAKIIRNEAVKVTVTFVVTDKVEKIYIESGGRQVPGLVWNNAKVGNIAGDPLYAAKVASGASVTLKVKTAGGRTCDLYDYIKGYEGYNLLRVDISNRDVVQNTFLYSSGISGYYLVATKPGSSKVNYLLNDGSKKKFTLSVKVSK